MAGRMELEFNIRGEAAGRLIEDRPFNLLVLGPFSGPATPGAESGRETQPGNRIRPVDLDSLDDLWARYRPQIRFEAGPGLIEFTPTDIDDFHPDHLYRQLPVFAELRETRRRLRDPATAQATLDGLLAPAAPPEPATPAVESGGPPADDEAPEALFERLLGKSGSTAPARPAPPARTAASLDEYIRRLVAPHVVEAPNPRVDTAIDSVDRATADLMREILHHPAFQSLESTWRSLFELVSALELDENLRLFVCDIGRDDLLNALPEPGAALTDCDLFRLLANRGREAVDDTPWTVIAGDFLFGPGPEDVALLTALGAAAAANGGIFIGGARPELLGCRTTAELADARYWSGGEEPSRLWRTLRASPVADRIGLALPRVLLRLPYGEDSEAIDSFDFEEMPERNHEHYLWANPAWACARLLAQSFTQDGWRMRAGDHVDLGFLPAHHYREDGESRLQPCAELLLSESTMVAILDEGLMPLISYRNQNTAVLGRFQSISDPAAPLAGPWQSG